MTQWIMVGLAIGAVLYNTIVTHVVMKNDIRHLQEDVAENKSCLKKLMFHFLKE